MTDAIIFDIDGTLADVAHRRHHVTGSKKNWDSFFAEMVNDPPFHNVCWLADLISNNTFEYGYPALFIFSGRPEKYRFQTEKWLSMNASNLFTKAEALLMREDGDTRPDTEVKRDMLNAIKGQGYEPRLVIDDRPSVIEMWKAEGLTVLAHDGGWNSDAPVYAPGILSILVGPSGAGKTTFIKNTYFGSVVSSDALRLELTGDFKNQSKNDQVFSALHTIVKSKIRHGLDTVVDATNLRSSDRRKLRDLCPQNTKINYFVIDRPLEEKHRDAGWRDYILINGVKLIDKHHQTFQSGIKHILAGDNDPRVTVHDFRKWP